MNERIDAPSKFRGKNEKEQIEQIYRYLTTLSEKLNYLFLKNTDDLNSLTDKTNDFIESQEETSYLQSGAVKDFVINSGTFDIWTYRKWLSGISECWGTVNVTTAVNNTWGNLYASGALSSLNIAFPTGLFTAPPVLNANLTTTPYAGFLINAGDSENRGVTASRTGVFSICRGSALSAAKPFTVQYYAVGRWK